MRSAMANSASAVSLGVLTVAAVVVLDGDIGPALLAGLLCGVAVFGALTWLWRAARHHRPDLGGRPQMVAYTAAHPWRYAGALTIAVAVAVGAIRFAAGGSVLDVAVFASVFFGVCGLLTKRRPPRSG